MPESYFNLTVGGKSKSVARGTEMIGHAADESKTACVTGNPVRTGGIVELVRSLDDGRIAFLEI